MSYTLLKYEYDNELVIFWNFGINKITFIKMVILFLYVIIYMYLLVPVAYFLRGNIGFCTQLMTAGVAFAIAAYLVVNEYVPKTFL